MLELQDVFDKNNSMSIADTQYIVLIIAIVQAIKISKIISSKYLGLIALLLGAILGFYIDNIIKGLICGLMASGLWSTSKNVFKKKLDKKLEKNK